MKENNQSFRKQLEQRTLNFSIAVLRNLSSLPDAKLHRILQAPLARSATSIGANYREANQAESRSDFIHKIAVSAKEANETLYWIEIWTQTGWLNDTQSQAFKLLLCEASELYALFQSIHRSARNPSQNTNTLTH
jgi:four helix bundle protein